jgi:hypothetical protein
MEMAFSFQHHKDKPHLTIFPVRNAGRGTSKDLSCVQWIVCKGVVRVWSMKRGAKSVRALRLASSARHFIRTLIKGMMDGFPGERFFVR